LFEVLKKMNLLPEGVKGGVRNYTTGGGESPVESDLQSSMEWTRLVLPDSLNILSDTMDLSGNWSLIVECRSNQTKRIVYRLEYTGF